MDVNCPLLLGKLKNLYLNRKPEILSSNTPQSTAPGAFSLSIPKTLHHRQNSNHNLQQPGTHRHPANFLLLKAPGR
jgi:hypothetical protein